MENKAIHRNARMSAQKVRLVADLVRGMKVSTALDVLNLSPKASAPLLKKVINSATANAEHNSGADVDELVIKTICIDKAGSLKRFTQRAKGRGNKIEKQNCHIAVTVGI